MFDKINKDHIIGFFIGIALLYTLYYIRTSINNKCDPLSKVVHILSRQAARWATAATQDKNPLIAVLHANYGAGYLWALQDIATDSQIKRFTKIDFPKFKDKITQVHDATTKRMIAACPKFAPPRTYLTDIGGE